MEKAVLFDFDGTLVDSYADRRKAHVRVAAFLSSYLIRNGFEIPRDTLVASVEAAESVRSRRREWDRDDWWRAILEEHTGETSTGPPEKVLSEATLKYWNTIAEVTTVYPHVEPLLKALDHQAIPVGIISDTDGLTDMKHRRIEESGLGRYADVIVVAGEDTSNTKPDVEPFERAADDLGLPTERCVFVGDNPGTDVHGAAELGMTTVLVRNDDGYFDDADADPDYTVDRTDFVRLQAILAEHVDGFERTG